MVDIGPEQSSIAMSIIMVCVVIVSTQHAQYAKEDALNHYRRDRKTERGERRVILVEQRRAFLFRRAKSRESLAPILQIISFSDQPHFS